MRGVGDGGPGGAPLAGPPKAISTSNPGGGGARRSRRSRWWPTPLRPSPTATCGWARHRGGRLERPTPRDARRRATRRARPSSARRRWRGRPASCGDCASSYGKVFAQLAEADAMLRTWPRASSTLWISPRAAGRRSTAAPGPAPRAPPVGRNALRMQSCRGRASRGEGDDSDSRRSSLRPAGPGGGAGRRGAPLPHGDLRQAA